MEKSYYITRRKDLIDHAEATEITLQEWTGFVSKDPDMQLENVTTVTLDDGTQYTYPSPGRAIWFYREPGNTQPDPIIFDYNSGNIVITNAQAATLQKIRHIAFKLNASILLETDKDTGLLLASPPALAPRFTFKTIVAPFKKIVIHIGHAVQQSFFSFFKSSPEKLIQERDDQRKDQS